MEVAHLVFNLRLDKVIPTLVSADSWIYLEVYLIQLRMPRVLLSLDLLFLSVIPQYFVKLSSTILLFDAIL